MYSLTGFAIFSAFIAYISKGKLLKKALVFMVGFPLIYLLNIVRITSIVLLGYNFGAEAATQAFHIMGGIMLTFIAVLFLLIIMEKFFKLQIFTHKEVEPSHSCPVNNRKGNEAFCVECGKIFKNSPQKISRRAIVKILLLLSLASLTILIQAPTFALVKGPEEINLEAGPENLVGIFPEIPEYSLSFVYRDEEFEKLAGQDASLLFLYKPENNSNLAVWVSLEIADTRAPLHRWEVCLITWPEKQGKQVAVTVLDQRDIDLLDNPPIFGRYLAIQWKDNGELQVILYWYETLVFRVGSGYQTKNVKISVVGYGYNLEDYKSIEDRLFLFAKATVGHLQPVKLWSTFTLITSQYSVQLLGVTATSLAILVILQIVNDYNRRRKNLKIYRKLDLEDKLAIDALTQSSEPTLANIAARYRELSGKSLESNDLLEKLREAKEIGLVDTILANRNDEPILLWKSEVPT
jgi:exosortase/archaeosortase family protein